MAREDHLVITSDKVQPFDYAVGLYGSKFFKELKENKQLVGVKCPKCGKVYVPPKKVCGDCFAEMTEFVEVGNQGVIMSYTIVRFSFINSETGEQKPVPYGYGFVRLDGADNMFQHYIELKDESKIKVGARVEVVFAEERHGDLNDIVHFRVLD